MKSAINVFMVNLIESVVIVILVVMLFMGFRSGYIIGAGLVIVVLGSLLVLYMMHGTLQRVSLASFIVAMGMLVDNAIVITDGILVDLKKGDSQAGSLGEYHEEDGLAFAGSDHDRDSYFLADIFISRYHGRVCPGFVYRFGRVLVVELDSCPSVCSYTGGPGIKSEAGRGGR